jgi:hypothetical protein
MSERQRITIHSAPPLSSSRGAQRFFISTEARACSRSLTSGPNDCEATMPFPKDCYGPETLGLMTQAFDAAWEEAEYALASNTFESE